MATMARFDLPHFFSRQHARKWRVLTQTLTFFGFGGQYQANVMHGSVKPAQPLRVIPLEGVRTGIQFRPARKIGPRHINPFRMFRQPGGDASGHFQTRLILNPMIHALTLIQTCDGSESKQDFSQQEK
jgi:hypothetical protein